jgi:hypothetical protein
VRVRADGGYTTILLLLRLLERFYVLLLPLPWPYAILAIIDELRDQRGQRRRYWPMFAPWVQ